MARHVTLSYADFDSKPAKVLVVFADPKLEAGDFLKRFDKKSSVLKAGAEAAGFEGKSGQVMDLIAPELSGSVKRLIVFGVGDVDAMEEKDWVNLGGKVSGKLRGAKVEEATLALDLDGVSKKHAADLAGALGLGADLRGYAFDGYKSKKKKRWEQDGDGNEAAKAQDLALTIVCADPKGARKAGDDAAAVAAGVCKARDLVNMPANLLGPVEFVTEIKKLESLGIELSVLDERSLEAHGMNALLSVGHGSEKPSRAVIMSWWGAKSRRSAPIAVVGKGVTFDTGGISLKPSKGMEDMKGDMGGAACVTGLMHTLAQRKAPINVIGLVGLVENMPSDKATRPGDVITSASGQTIEVLNTDAEGRLVLADLLWYAEKELNPRPKAIVDLATLTGAIMVALGKHYAGMFANEDRLAAQLHEAGEATGERVWRLPLDKAYDKMIDSPIADMKNIGGRYAGATTAAQFLQRFVDETPWAHLDVAGMAMASNRSDVNTSWGSGFGVRLLNDWLRQLEK